MNKLFKLFVMCVIIFLLTGCANRISHSFKIAVSYSLEATAIAPKTDGEVNIEMKTGKE